MEISDYLKCRSKPSPDKNYYVGQCRVCEAEVPWKLDRLVSHKTGGNCEGQEESERQSFLVSKKKRKIVSIVSEVSASNTQSTKSQPTSLLNNFVDRLSQEGLEQLKDAYGQLFYRTGIPFQVAESKAMLKLVTLLKPTFAKCLPNAKELGGVMLNREYLRLKELAAAMIHTCTSYSIVTDGWSNIRNEHLVNYVLLIPGSKPFFLKSISTAGIPQTAA
jgi:hypothetical protein